MSAGLQLQGQKSVTRYHITHRYCKNDIKDNKNKLKNNIIHSKGIANSYKNKYIDHTLFKKGNSTVTYWTRSEHVP